MFVIYAKQIPQGGPMVEEAQREVLGEALERLDIDVPTVVVDGAVHHRVLSSTETYTSAVGPVTVARTLYRQGRQAAVVPVELRAGIIDGHWTPLAAPADPYLLAATPAVVEQKIVRAHPDASGQRMWIAA